jgi:hypothetical protein
VRYASKTRHRPMAWQTMFMGISDETLFQIGSEG